MARVGMVRTKKIQEHFALSDSFDEIIKSENNILAVYRMQQSQENALISATEKYRYIKAAVSVNGTTDELMRVEKARFLFGISIKSFLLLT